MSQPYVFISYSRQDRHFVERLSQDLQQAGVQTWTDVEDIPAGADFAQSIERSLAGASVMIYVSSENAARSEWMVHELEAFLARPGSKVVPIDLDGTGTSFMPEALHRIQWLRFDGEDYADALKHLLKALKGVRGTASIPERKAKSKGYVFISYAFEDTEFVSELKLFLTKRGFAFWDYLASRRDYQRDYTLELEDRISNAEATLTVVSPDWKKSRTALQELHFSTEVGTPVFILKVRPLGPTLALAGLTFIDFAVSRSDGFAKLAEEMQASGL